MPHAERSISINASAQKIEDILISAGHASEVWNASRFTPDSKWPAAGSTATSESKIGPLSLSSTIHVLEHTPGVKHVQRLEGPLTGVMTWEFQPEGNGTRFTLIFDYDIPPGAF